MGGGSYSEVQMGCVSQLSGRTQQRGIQKPRMVCVYEPQSSEWEGGLLAAGWKLRKGWVTKT